MTAWPGTFLSAVFLAPSKVWTALPGLLARWGDAGLLLRGSAKWLELPPTQVSYEAVMNGPRGYETAWCDGVTSLVEQARKATLLQLSFPIGWEHGQGELTLDLVVNPDNSVGVYLNAPYAEVYEQQPPQMGHLNIERFVSFACLLFAPSEFILGVIGEEARLSGLTEESAWPDDWAFYGADLSKDLLPLLASLSTQAQDIRQVGAGGVFVRWTRWDEPTRSPQEWRWALRRAQAAYLQT